MKADQDALERRLWAKQEKVKAEHERLVKAERDMCVWIFQLFSISRLDLRARITQRQVSTEKEAVSPYHKQTALKSHHRAGQISSLLTWTNSIAKTVSLRWTDLR